MVMTIEQRPSRPILAVEDDRYFREALDFVLTAHGYPCSSAGNAVEARQIIGKSAPAVAIVDLGLPGENGLDLAKWILETEPNTSVLIVTGNADSAVVRDAIGRGVTSYLVKPVAPEELIDAVSRAICASVAAA
jgi:DNA-binding NtrC family response regulator